MAIAINTSQNVLLEYEPASIGERILATIVDGLVFIAWLLLTVALPLSLGVLNNTEDLTIVYYVVVVGIPYVFYNLLSEWLLNGQSIGKIALKIRVVMMDGSQPGIGAYLLRWLLRLIDIQLFYALPAIISIAAGGKGQRLGDMAAGTTVIRLKPRVSLADITFNHLPDNYRVMFPEVTQLSDQDIRVVREVLQRGTSEAVFRTAAKIKEVLALDTHLDNYQFLNTVVNDYQFLAVQE
jgi:uncharacterized RDD family membrane protein YckC